jgi:glutaredoxin 3
LARIEIYSSMLCGYSYRAKKLLDSKSVAYEEIDVMLSPGRRTEMVARSGGRRSVPQIFLDGQHLGDCEELYALEAAGKLDPILGRAGLGRAGLGRAG